MDENFKFDWVVIRSTEPAAADVAGETDGTWATPKGTVLVGAGPSRPDAASITVSQERMSFGESAEAIPADKGIVAAAPLLPMTLIEPTASKASEPPKIERGITEIGAEGWENGGEGVTVAVLDTGIDASHPAFDGVKLVQQNFTDAADHDTNGHGTHCAGTIFGRNVNGTRIGVARGVKQALIAKVLGPQGGDTQSIVRAIQWAQALGADVISMSLGIDFTAHQAFLVKRGLHPRQATALTLEGFRLNILMFAALAKVIGGRKGLVEGCVVLAAAGNSSQSPHYTIAAEPPANSEGFISVAALDRPADSKQRLASFSNVGAKLAAPGVDIWSAAPGGGLAAMSGTSMATPMAAGMACIWTQHLRSTGHGATSQEIIDALRKSAAPLTPDIPHSDVEWGRVAAP